MSNPDSQICWQCDGVTEASSLGFSPGEWPLEVTVTMNGCAITLARGEPFANGYVYSGSPVATLKHFTLKVFND